MFKKFIFFPLVLAILNRKWIYRKLINLVINSPLLYLLTRNTKCHSVLNRLNVYNFKNVFITPVSCLWDNYAYLIVDLERSRLLH